MSDDTIELRPVTRDNWRQTLELGVKPEQQRFVADHSPVAALMLAKAYIRPDGLTWLPYVVYRGEQPIGMMQLIVDPLDGREVWLRHFFIDWRYQGRGAGGAALRAFLNVVREEHPACTAVRLTVHPENELAQALYQRHGFVPSGTMIDGEPEYVLGIAP